MGEAHPGPLAGVPVLEKSRDGDPLFPSCGGESACAQMCSAEKLLQTGRGFPRPRVSSDGQEMQLPLPPAVPQFPPWVPKLVRLRGEAGGACRLLHTFSCYPSAALREPAPEGVGRNLPMSVGGRCLARCPQTSMCAGERRRPREHSPQGLELKECAGAQPQGPGTRVIL